MGEEELDSLLFHGNCAKVNSTSQEFELGSLISLFELISITFIAHSTLSCAKRKNSKNLKVMKISINYKLAAVTSHIHPADVFIFIICEKPKVNFLFISKIPLKIKSGIFSFFFL